MNCTRRKDVFKTMAPEANMESGLLTDVAGYAASQRVEGSKGSNKPGKTEVEKESVINKFLPFIKYL
jgi:hypothetical protein